MLATVHIIYASLLKRIELTTPRLFGRLHRSFDREASLLQRAFRKVLLVNLQREGRTVTSALFGVLDLVPEFLLVRKE